MFTYVDGKNCFSKEQEVLRRMIFFMQPETKDLFNDILKSLSFRGRDFLEILLYLTIMLDMLLQSTHIFFYWFSFMSVGFLRMFY
ncbi:hypothetical protein OIU77_017601 [Salix suchowensis]|uniref:Uncharacterized protein n=1 Tax=Salix suchowensis TaxID=1278906 RepID=A0ABQ8ZPL3_9ROSI|nr:hypothetical protein OIU77_017601 [Salix suchowensis]